MAKPTILTVDDDPAVSQAITRDLRRQYGADYQIVRATSGADALQVLSEFALRDRDAALILSDQRMPKMTGVEFLEEAKVLAPDAKLVLLTAYADTDAAIKAINDIGLDRYLLKPWDPPDERLYPVLDDLLHDWHRAQRPDAPRVRIVGHRWSERGIELKTFLTRNYVPYQWIDLERDADAVRLQEAAGATEDDLPLVVLPDGEPLRAPSTLDVAKALGLRTSAEQPLYDVCVVGGGPAGLAAAVYAASEGLQTIVIERQAPGGQASLSAAIENYLGFPKGLSGADLTQRAVAQAQRFGAEMVVARDVCGFRTQGPVRTITFADGTELDARCIIVATGVSYRRLDAPGLKNLTGRGVYYGATASEARGCEGEDVFVVGAANSAGQAVLNIARFARKVTMLVRAESLEASMSQYLIERIRATENVEVRFRTEVVSGKGSKFLEQISIVDRDTGAEEDHKTSWLFAYIGAFPLTDWLGDEVGRDENGFVVTGPDLMIRTDVPSWPLERAPYALETSVPGVFCAGDVRLDSMKRVASAVGEGAMAVHYVHRYLASI